jgi:hypothetical protein
MKSIESRGESGKQKSISQLCEAARKKRGTKRQERGWSKSGHVGRRAQVGNGYQLVRCRE